MKSFSLLVILVVMSGPFAAATSMPSSSLYANEANLTDATEFLLPEVDNAMSSNSDLVFDSQSHLDSPLDGQTEQTSPSDGSAPLFDLNEAYKDYFVKRTHPTTDFYGSSGEGIHIDYSADGNCLLVKATIGSYDLASYSIGSRTYQIVTINSAQLTHEYGEPIIPYAKEILTMPFDADIVSYSVSNEIRSPLNNLALMPGPKPMSVSDEFLGIEPLFFDPSAYLTSGFKPSDAVKCEVVGVNGQNCLSIELYPLQYNPVEKTGRLLLQFVVEIAFTSNVNLADFRAPTGPEPLAFGDGEGYLIVVDQNYVSYLDEFVDWKTFLGFDIYVTSVQDIVSTYSGRDAAEKLRNCIIDRHTLDDIEYVLLVGDGDVVPAREVWDPYYAGGIDNGTEASDLYFECLDGDWDANGNNLFGEVDDAVDFYPEVMVGRIPVQTPEDAAQVLHAITKMESDPEPGDWMDDFLLLGPDCFVPGDGAAMTEAELNQPYLIGSFFDVDRLYPTDGSLNNPNVIERINQGVGIIDFFDHGAYNIWVDSLTVSQTLALTNGYYTPFAFAMACETAAFDYEAGEPTMGEAFFRNPGGGAAAYIGATRIAWAGYYAFDGLHNRYWTYFFDTALSQYSASPKIALRDAINEMVMTYDMEDPISRETVIQAIYFGDPTMQLYWKNEVDITSTPADINQEVSVEVGCATFNHLPLTDVVSVMVKDPLGNLVVNGQFLPDNSGHFTIYHSATENPGLYTAQFSFTQPFVYSTERTYSVGLAEVNVSLDSSPVYQTPLFFSGFSEVDGNGTAYLLDSSGNIISSTSFDVAGGTFSNSINIASFGSQALYVKVISPVGSGGADTTFEVMRGHVLIIADESGGYGPWYPGGWVDSNAGDSTNYGDIYQALKDEYYLDVFRPRYELTPDLAFLESYDAVVVSVGDHYEMPLIAPDSFLLGVLMEYHDAGGNLLFEGASILTPLEAQYSDIFSSFFHVELEQRIVNSGGMYLENGAHPITSGLPSTIWIEDGLGSPLAEVLIPTSGSAHVSGYSGDYTGGTAIAALNPTATEGGLVFFGFSVDGVSDISFRNILLRNAVNFLLYPSITCSLSDYALPTGDTETIQVVVTDSRTGTPLEGALVYAVGCGVATENLTLGDGSCTILVNPTVAGQIAVNVTKADYLSFETRIISYDIPLIGLDISPEYLERDTTSIVSLFCYDFYEGYSLENCYVVLDGCGVLDSGLSSQTGEIEFTVHPITSGTVQINATLSGYADAYSSIGVRLIAAVVRGYFTEYPEEACWDRINGNWQHYGDIPIYIDYASLNIAPITLDDIQALAPDVLIMAYMYQPLDESELEAILEYTRQGHGLVVTSSCISFHSAVLGAFMGMDDSLTWTSTWDIGIGFESLDVLEPEHPVFNEVPNPYSVGYSLSYLPSGIRWDNAALMGASMLALDYSPDHVAAVTVYRGLVYSSNIPEYQSNAEDVQLVYNMIAWSSYEIPGHDLGVALCVPRTADPDEEILVEAQVMNLGLNPEYDVTMSLHIDGSEVASELIPSIESGMSYLYTYPWTPSSEGLYSIELFVDPVAGEDTLANNYVQRYVNVFELALDGPVAVFQSWDPWGLSSNEEILDLWMIPYDIYDETAIGVIDLSVYQKVIVPSDQPDWFMEAVFYNIAWFEEYAASGGILEIHAATNSYWVNGLLPGGAHYVQYPDDLVTIADPMHATLWTPNIITDAELDYWGASVHGYLDSVPFGCDIILTTDSGEAVFIEQTFGMGSIVISTQTLEWGLYFGYSRILENILLYVPVQPDHDLAAYLDMAARSSPGEYTLITATTINQGLNPETDVIFHLYVDGVEVNATNIAQLSSGESVSLMSWWMSEVEGSYDVLAYVEPVSGEENTLNNYASKVLVVTEFHDYRMNEYNPVWLDAKANGFNTGLTGDDASTGIALPFTFRFYDRFFDAIYISSNGWLSFDNPNPSEFYTPPWPTSDPVYRYALAPLFADLQAENNIYAWITEDWVVIQYDNYHHLSGSLMGTFEVILHSSGLIQFNYLEMYNVVVWEIPVVGLNYGDGIYGPTYYGSDLSGVVDFGLEFTYELPEHDLAVMLDLPSILNPGTSINVDAVVWNYGSSDEYDVHVVITLDGTDVADETIPYLPASSQYTVSYFWYEPQEGIYYFNATVDPVAGESILSNNYAFKEVSVFSLIVITSPTDGEAVQGGQVLVTFEVADAENLQVIYILVNEDDVSSVYYNGLNQVLVPIFSEGLNEIKLVALWSDNVNGNATVHVDSTGVVPLAALDPGDYLNYRFFYDYGLIDEFNFTFGSYVSESEVEVELLLHEYDGSGYDETAYLHMIVNVLNGYIAWSDFGWDYQHFFPFTGISSPEVIGYATSGDIATFFFWNDLYMISDLGEWRGYSVWYAYGLQGDFSCSVLESNGLLVEMYFGLPEPYCYAEVVDTNLIPGLAENRLSIVRPTEDEVIEGGLVYVEYSGTNLANLLQIDVFVNDQFLYTTPYNGYDGLFVPVFLNGTNTISLIATWNDATVAIANVAVVSAAVIPIAQPKAGDYLDFRIMDQGMIIDFNFTFNGMASEFETDATVLYHVYNDQGTIIMETLGITVNVLNGYIPRSDFYWDTYHFLFFTGLSAPNAIQSYAQIGDLAPFFMWGQVLTIMGPAEWCGEAVWVMSSDSGDIFALVLQSNGLLVFFDSMDEITPGNGTITATNMIPPFDNVPPAWVFLPEDQYLGPGESLYYDLDAVDPAGIGAWGIDDTVHFAINSEGVVTNIIPLEDGIYPIWVSVSDTYGNTLTGTFNVIVETITGPIYIDGDDDFVSQGWPGSGTPEDPYVIAGLQIDCSQIYTPCIEIRNTQTYFVVRDCGLIGNPGLPVLYLSNVENGFIQGNNCTGGAFGILLESCSLTALVDNDCFGNDFGILVFSATLCQLMGNNCFENIEGMMLVDTSMSAAFDNACTMNQDTGISINGTSYWNDISDNYLQGNFIGIYEFYSSNNTFINNTCIQNMFGIISDYSFGDYFAWNNILSNEYYGLVLVDTADTIAEYNSIVENQGIGIYILWGTADEITYNYLAENAQGIVLDSTTSNHISWNTIEDCLDVGMILYQSEWNLLEFNVLTGNNAGVYILEYSTANEVTWNVFENMQYNMVDDVENNYVQYNYWSDYIGPDDDNDGYGDVPYEIYGFAENEDSSPLIYYPWHLEWLETPDNVIVGFGELLEYRFQVIGYLNFTYYLSDNVNFWVDDEGYLRNATELAMGQYPLFIVVMNQWGFAISADFTVTVEDATSPEWRETPTDQVTEFGSDFRYDLNATDYSGIAYYWVNNTVSFAIDSDGILTNATSLAVGEYRIEVRAYDPFGNFCSAFVTVKVVDSTPPVWVIEPIDQVLEAGGDLSCLVEAWDLSGEVLYSVSPTGFFAISVSRLISNLHSLEVGVYPITVEARDVYGNVIATAFTLTVVDTSPPEWLEQPLDRSILQEQPFEYAVAVADASAIAWWTINDTANFRIDPMGDVSYGVAVISSLAELEPGVYGLEIRVCDVFGNIQTATLTITVIQATTISLPVGGMVIIVTEAACLIVILLVIAMNRRRR